MVQTHLAVSVDNEVVGFDSEELRRWWEVAVRRGNVFGLWVGGSVGGGGPEIGEVFVVMVLWH